MSKVSLSSSPVDGDSSSSISEATDSFGRSVLPLAILMLLAAIPLLPMLFTGGSIQNGDMSLTLTLGHYLGRLAPMWTPYSQTNLVQSIDRLWINVIPLWFGYHAGLPMLLGYKLFFLFGIELGAVGEFVLIKSLCREFNVDRSRFITIVAVGASLFFVYSPWADSWYQGMDFFYAYALLPWCLLFYRSYLSHGKWRYLFLGILALSCSFSTPHFLVVDSAWLFLFTILIWLDMKKAHLQVDMRRLYRRVATFVACLTVMNLYWLVPSLILTRSGGLSPGVAVDAETVKSLTLNYTWTNVIIGHDQWVNWYVPLFIHGRVFLLVAAITPSCALVFALFIENSVSRSNLFRLIRISAFAGIIITSCATLPYVSNAYDLAATGLPFGYLLRTPIAFTAYWWLGVPIFIVLGLAGPSTANRNLDSASRRVASVGGRQFLTWLLALLLAIPSLATAGVEGWRLWTFYYRGTSVPIQYLDAYRYLQDIPRPNQQLLLDMAPYEEGAAKNSLGYADSYTWNPGRLVGMGLPASVPIPTIAYYMQTTPMEQFGAIADKLALGSPEALGNWLKDGGITYVLFHNDIVGAKGAGEMQLATLRDVGQLVHKWGFVYLFKIPNSRPTLELVPGKPALLGSNLYSFLQSPIGKSEVVFADEYPLDYAQRINLGEANCSSDLGLSQLLLTPLCGSVTIFPAVGDPHSFSFHWWNALESMQFVDGTYPWSTVSARLGYSDEGYFDLGNGMIVGSYPSGSGHLKIVSASSKTSNGDYRSYVRALVGPSGGDVQFKANGTSWTVDLKAPHPAACWIAGPNVHVSRGSIQVTTTLESGKDVLNAIGFESMKSPNSSTIDELYSTQRCEGAAISKRTLKAIEDSNTGTGRSTNLVSSKVNLVTMASGTTSIILPKSKKVQTLVSSEPCGVGWAISLDGRLSPQICADGYWAATVIPSHTSSIVLTIDYGPSQLWENWVVVSLAGTAGLVLLAGGELWYLRRKKARKID